MDLFDMLRHAGIVSLLSIAIGLAPLAMAAAYFARPTERRLALMRPLSLASLFAALTGGAPGKVDGDREPRAGGGTGTKEIPAGEAGGHVVTSWRAGARCKRTSAARS